jgi:SAM-dependent methyltransferase
MSTLVEAAFVRYKADIRLADDAVFITVPTVLAVSLSSQYKAQFVWRDWVRILDRLPPLGEGLVLDLGCGVGDLSAELVKRGANVIGLDSNEELLREARAKRLPGAEFRVQDLREPLGYDNAHGIWCSFVAACFCDLTTILRTWAQSLKAGGWIALTEVDDLFGHRPLADRTREILDDFARESLSNGLYDFHMGAKLRNHLTSAGFSVSEEFTVEDQELSFNGPAIPDVVAAWRARFDRLRFLRNFCGSDFAQVRDDFLGSLGAENHVSTAKVCCCIATF